MHFARNTVYENINSKYVTTRFLQQDTTIFIIETGALYVKHHIYTAIFIMNSISWYDDIAHRIFSLYCIYVRWSYRDIYLAKYYGWGGGGMEMAPGKKWKLVCERKKNQKRRKKWQVKNALKLRKNASLTVKNSNIFDHPPPNKAKYIKITNILQFINNILL